MNRVTYTIDQVSITNSFQLESYFGNCFICGDREPYCIKCLMAEEELKNPPPIIIKMVIRCSDGSPDIYLMCETKKINNVTKEEFDNAQ